MTRLLALAVLSGCVMEPANVPADAQIGCQNNNDCALGEECRAGTCFGGPEGVEFAAELFPPESRKADLAPAEITKLEVSRSGVVNVKFVPTVAVTGRVLVRSNDPLSSAAQVQFHRPSRINGAPDYIVTVDAQTGFALGQAAFSVRLPPNTTNEHYELAIRPDDGTIRPLPPNTPPPIALAPPFISNYLPVTKDFYFYITLDSGLRHLSGKVLDAGGTAIAGMRVRAWSRSSPLAPLEAISSQGTTDERGAFDLYLPQSLSNVFTLRVVPGPDVKGHPASLERKDVRPGIGETTLPDITYPPLVAAADYTLPVTFQGTGASLQPATGASVTFSATLLANDSDTITFDASSTVDAAGLATVSLLPGTYAVAVHPPPTPGQLGGELWSTPVVAGTAQLKLSQLILPTRVPVSGKVVDADGMPAAKMNISAKPSADFLAGIVSDTDRARVAALPATEVLTKDDGTYSINLDPTLAGLAVTYDITAVPPSGSHLPRGSIGPIPVSADTGPINAGMTMLKKGALASGIISDIDGHPVAGAELRVYERIANAPAKLRAVVESDKDGNVLLVLPSP